MKYPRVKFIKSVATKCVENFSDKDVPALFFYKGGDLLGQKIPAAPELGGLRMNFSTVEFVLSKAPTGIEVEYEEDPRNKLKLMNTIIRKGKDAGRGHENEDHSEEEDDRDYVSNQYQQYR